jgi:alpha-1,3-rhamnosyl/mannosyltransferase
VRFFENLPAADLPAIYNGASVFVLPSHYEGFGFPVLEAMGCGVPTIVSNRASLPEIGGEATLTVDPDDLDALGDAMLRVLTDSALRETMRTRGLERVENFTWDKTVQATLALYSQVLGG